MPPWTVTVFATRDREFTGGTYGLPCALIIKKLNPGERHNKAVASRSRLKAGPSSAFRCQHTSGWTRRRQVPSKSVSGVSRITGLTTDRLAGVLARKR